jgi:hypothetical protein
MFKYLLIFLFCSLFSLSSRSQDFQSLLSTDNPETWLDLEGMISDARQVKDTRHPQEVKTQAIDFSQRIIQGKKIQTSIGFRFQKLDFSRGFLLNDFFQQEASAALKYNLENDRFYLTRVGFGSASDRPFQASRDNTLNATGIMKFKEKWFGAINYSNNRAFLNNVPLPGVIYVASAGRFESLIIGFPFIYWLTPFHSDWSFRYQGFLPWTHRLRLLFTKFQFARPYFGIEQQPLTFFRYNRDKSQDRIFWFERRLHFGVETGLSRNFRIDLGGGYSFDRTVFEARKFSGEKGLKLDLPSAWFVSLNLKLRL